MTTLPAKAGSFSGYVCAYRLPKAAAEALR